MQYSSKTLPELDSRKAILITQYEEVACFTSRLSRDVYTKVKLGEVEHNDEALFVSHLVRTQSRLNVFPIA